MKSSKIDRIISVVVIGTCLIKAVLYGGSKPPSTTNEPPSDISGDAPTNPPPMMCFSPRPMMSPPPEQAENEPSATHRSYLKLRGTRAALTATGFALTSRHLSRSRQAQTS